MTSTASLSRVVARALVSRRARGGRASSSSTRRRRILPARLRAVVPDDARALDAPSTRARDGNDLASGFVEFFRQASPYIALHRGSTFVVLIPGDVSASPERMESIVRDVSLLHDLGVRIVLVVGASVQVSELTRMRGGDVAFLDDYRVTDEAAMEAAMEANGKNQVLSLIHI